jgi:osmoprotectant transport system ATP-binding protein
MVSAMSQGHGAASVAFDRVSKRYGADRAPEAPGAVNDLTLDVPAGRICVLVGPSGCGKTTSLRMVNRLIEPTSGRILLDGVDVASRDPVELRRSIGYVIQQVGLFPHQRVWENVATVPRLIGVSSTVQRERADELLVLVGLDPATHGQRFPAELSGGERQRVGVARALAADPPILLMDEPFGAVDPLVRDRLQNELLRIQERLAKTILFVTHDIDEAIKMGDLVAVMDGDGRLAQFGPPAEILAEPASGFVARFVGTDRGLKRLSLARVRDLTPAAAPTVRLGATAIDDAADGSATELRHRLVVDEADRPVGWIRADRIGRDGPLTSEMATPMSPLLAPETTLKDALSMLIDAEVLAGVVVDRDGRVGGILTMDAIAAWLRSSARPSDEA